MTLKEAKTKVLSLIEELNPESEYLTDDPDIQLKINSVFNQIQVELCRLKKIPAKYVYDIEEHGNTLLIQNIPDIYQLNHISTDKYEIKGDMEIVFDEDAGDEATIYYYKYPELIDVIIEPEEIEVEVPSEIEGGEPTITTRDETPEEASARIDEEYVFELTEDVLEIMPYGVAADLLKNDMISNYGRYYDERYNMLKQLIDSRIASGLIVAEGGLDF